MTTAQEDAAFAARDARWRNALFWRDFAWGPGVYLGYSAPPPPVYVTSPLPDRVPPLVPPDQPVASICWGVPSKYQYSQTNPPESLPGNGGINVIFPEEPHGVDILEWEEIDKDVEKVRITNPDDADQWVEIERRKSSLLQTDKGILIRITFKNDDLGGSPVG